MTIRTSISHPLRIATLPVGDHGGAIGVSFAPGKRQAKAMTGQRERDIDLDLNAIRRWGASDLITLLEPQEFEELGIQEPPDRANAHGLASHGLPITDGCAPDDRFLADLRALGPTWIENLRAGGRIIKHCKGGLGRAGTVACLFLLDSGTASDATEAITTVRQTRPGAVETVEQEALFWRAWQPTPPRQE